MLPSEVKTKSYRGYHRDIFEGWKKLPEATIIGEGYRIEFSRLSEKTIDPMCDALNGWFNIWTKYCCEYADNKGKLSITVHKPEDADKLFTLLSNITPVEFENEELMSAVVVARIKLETIINMIMDSGGKEKNAIRG